MPNRPPARRCGGDSAAISHYIRRATRKSGRTTMDAAELRAMQAPIKERYKTDPSAAVITLKAKGSIDNEGIACKVETGRALAVAGLHPATGGSGLELCSGDMLLEALVACAGVTLKSVATAVEVPLEDRQRHRRGRSRFPRHARRRQGSAGRLRGNPPALRGRHRRAAGQARSAAEAHRALLRGLSDHQERPEGFGVDEAGVSHSTRCRPGLAKREPGPITTGVRCVREAVQRSSPTIDKPRLMGPCVRRDDR